MKRSLIFACLLINSISPAEAQQAIHWKTTGDWDILMDQTMGNACYVTATYLDGTVLRLGFNFSQAEKTMYFALGNAKWKALEADKDYQIVVTFDGQTPWKASAVGVDFADAKWLFINGLNTSFATEFSRKHGMAVTFNGREVVSVRLKGSSKAMNELIACQNTVNDVMAGNPQKQAPAPATEDPFATTPGVKSATDPFDL